MKAFLLTLLILGGFFLAYDAFLAPPHQRLVFEKGPAPKPAPKTPATATTPPPPAAAPVATASTAPATPTAPPARPGDFVPPAIPSLEEATRNWTVIPDRAFPRQVVLKQPVSVKMSVGSSQLAAGSSATALSAMQGVLTVAPTPDSAARGTIPVTSTDFPEQIRSAYETWKNRRIELARQAWETRKKTEAAAAAQAGHTLAAAGQIDASGKPVANSSGQYDLLLESMRRGQVTEIRPDNIRHWGTARPGSVDGQPGWLVEIDFTASTIFGLFDTQAQAQIRDGKLVRWIYTGSGEEVP